MPELPDILLYIHSLEPRILNQTLERIRLASPFVVRSVVPPISTIDNQIVRGLRRLGKQIVLEFDNELFLVIHLMIAGRFQWKDKDARIPGKLGLAAFDFASGTLLLTEAGSKKRASLHLLHGTHALANFNRGGLEVLDSSLEEFREALTRENHTVKRSLTDPRLFSGIDNAYSDEILHRARMSPARLTKKMTEEEVGRLFRATRETLEKWRDRFVADALRAFPEKVTAFREGMAVHGRYDKPCPDCGTPVQRIVYADNESNYCPACQTGGKLLADRALSQLLRSDWPKTLEELEERKSNPPARGR